MCQGLSGEWTNPAVSIRQGSMVVRSGAYKSVFVTPEPGMTWASQISRLIEISQTVTFG